MDLTQHKIIFANSNVMDNLQDESVQLVVTSPPYPMIEMWDDIFINQNIEIKKALRQENGNLVFKLIHEELDQVWKECYRVLQQGGLACINIGDATRTIGNSFKLYSNHYRILSFCQQIGFDILPMILWKKQTNAPNKFMGSGMLPTGAYVTLEHEYILILRKGSKREFSCQCEKKRRQESAFFWEERNCWFSDNWDFKGIKQNKLKGRTRDRSGAFPFELVYRLINMFSVKGDTVLDPFLGTGTTTLGAISSERNSIGFEIDPHLKETIYETISDSINYLNNYIDDRIAKHHTFCEDCKKQNKVLKYFNEYHQIPVRTKQEINLEINHVQKIQLKYNLIEATYFK